MMYQTSRAIARLAGVLFLGVCLASPVLAQDAKQPPKPPEAVIGDQLRPLTQTPQKTPNRKELLAELYQRLQKAGDEDDAKAVSNAIEKLWQRSGSDTVDLLMDRVAKLMEKDEFDDSIKILDAIVGIAPDYPEGWTRRAAVNFARKNFAQSVEDLRHALALDPSHYKAIQGLGLLMQELGDKEAALKAFRMVLEIHPHIDDVRQAEKELTRELEGQGI